ncbi:MAG: TonB-dependent receptor [Candidatus Magnetobacterium sp. LHC-1]|nr:TonB-dependent receptor [Nitrospirota bacterium]
MKTFYVFCSLMLTVLLSLPLHADARDGNEPDAVKFDEIVVSATKTEREQDLTPTNVEVITSDEISKSVGISDMLHDIPGLSIGSISLMNTIFSVGFRGMEPTFREVLFLVDGFEMNIPTNLIDLSNISVDNIERIEVIKTPLTVLYGPYGVGGVINVITKEPKKELEGSASLLYGSFNTATPSAYIGGKLKNGINYSLEYSYLTSDGYRENSATRNNLITPRIRYTGDAIKIDTFLTFNKTDFETPGGLPIGQYKDDPRESLQKVHDGTMRYVNTGTRVRWRLTDASEMTFKTSYRDHDVHYNDYGFHLDFNNLYTWVMESNYKLITSIFGLDSTFLTGIEYRKSREDGDARADDYWKDLAQIYYGHNIEEDIWSGYTQLEVEPMERLMLNTGVRYDSILTRHTDKILTNNDFSRTDGALSPRVGFAYKISPALNLFGNYTHGIRSIMASRISFNITEDLKPEKEDSYELGLRGRLFDFVDYNMAGFYIMSKDKIVNTKGVFEAKNAAQAKSRGVESGIRFNLPRGFYVRLSYTYADARFVDFNTADASYVGKRVPNVPNHLLGNTLGWSNPTYGNVSVTARYSSDKYVDSGNLYSLGDYTVVDLKYVYTYKKFTLTLSGKNIFDKTYAEYGETTGGLYVPLPIAYPANGRSFYTSLAYYF